jgi:hypothetical protein
MTDVQQKSRTRFRSPEFYSIALLSLCLSGAYLQIYWSAKEPQISLTITAYQSCRILTSYRRARNNGGRNGEPN